MSKNDVNAPVVATRASGKRRRKPFNPNKWETSILTVRSKVLCLGVSYPSVPHQIEENLGRNKKLIYVDNCVEQAVELVRRNALTEMDGRDLARCLALEASNDTHAYTASMESGAVYGERHLRANFNRQGFVDEIKQAWGKSIKFRQIILDYFWIPRGSWVMTHWNRSFFDTTLPNFVKEDLFDFSSGTCKDDEVESFSTSGKGGGVAYLPFCLHCVKQIVGAIDILKKYYVISFIKKSELAEHALWAATSTIDPKSMQNWLGKAINQEDIYCTFTQTELMGSIDDPNADKDQVLSLLRRLEDFKDIRMIKMKVLKIYDPEFKQKKKSKEEFGIDIGGIDGLVDNPKNGYETRSNGKDAKNGSNSKKSCRLPTPPPPPITTTNTTTTSTAANKKKGPRKVNPKKGPSKSTNNGDNAEKKEMNVNNNQKVKKKTAEKRTYSTFTNKTMPVTVSEPSESSDTENEAYNNSLRDWQDALEERWREENAAVTLMYFRTNRSPRKSKKL